MSHISIKTMEIAGLGPALDALGLSYGRQKRSAASFSISADYSKIETFTKAVINQKDRDLIKRLVIAGDEHAKILRGVLVWCEINAPRYWWQEMVTYDKIGSQCLMSESTMHIQGKGLSTEDLITMKESLPEGTMQKRVYYFSYQTLRRIYFQRKGHRLPHWHEFCDWIKTLPFAEEFILIQ